MEVYTKARLGRERKVLEKLRSQVMPVELVPNRVYRLQAEGDIRTPLRETGGRGIERNRPFPLASQIHSEPVLFIFVVHVACLPLTSKLSI